ncbi:hypothetical protein BLNAU_19227 [Blattamonas nauphoetae]|uniref:Galactose oxidase n=1 Tax=Blattamonas nauphoetae TaxID=2049346 RepID=A0ABQ9X261_9EUKA|nr:hypothetical protein BLNAU_19227 [Blattamonas nauphoetae]
MASIPTWKCLIPSNPQGRCSHLLVPYKGIFHILGGMGEDPQSEITLNPVTGETTISHSKLTPRYGHTGSRILNHLYIFGGKDFSVRINDLFDYNLEDGSCHQIRAGGTPPTKRNCHVSAVRDESFLIFGGYDTEEEEDTPVGVLFNDLTEFNTAEKKWRHIPFANLPNDENVPPPIYLHCGCIVNDHDFYVFGGSHQELGRNNRNTAPTSNLFVFNLHTRLWKKIGPTFIHGSQTQTHLDLEKSLKWNPGEMTYGGRRWPAPRVDAHMLPYKGTLLLYGGYCGSTIYTDLWQYIPSLNHWICLTLQGTGPSQRSIPAVAIMDDKFFVHGGLRAKKHFSEIFSIELTVFHDIINWRLHQVLDYPFYQPIVEIPRIQKQKERRTEENTPEEGTIDLNSFQPSKYLTFGAVTDKLDQYFLDPMVLGAPDYTNIPHDVSDFTFIKRDLKSLAPQHNSSHAILQRTIDKVVTPVAYNHFNPLLHISELPNSLTDTTSTTLSTHQLAKESLVPFYLQEQGVTQYEFSMLSIICDIDTCDSYLNFIHDPTSEPSPDFPFNLLGFTELPSGAFPVSVLVHSAIIHERCPHLEPFMTPRSDPTSFHSLNFELAKWRKQPKKDQKPAILSELISKIENSVKQRAQQRDSLISSRLTELSCDAVLTLLGFVYSDKLLPVDFIPPLQNEYALLDRARVDLHNSQALFQDDRIKQQHWEVRVSQLGLKQGTPSWMAHIADKPTTTIPVTHFLDPDYSPELLSPTGCVQLHAKASLWNDQNLKTLAYNLLLQIATTQNIAQIISLLSKYAQPKIEKMFKGWLAQAKKNGILT